MESEFELIAKTFQGLEPVLAGELTDLGANNIQIGRRMVSFTGNQEMMYRANFALRTAIRVLKPIKHFKAESADEVYDAVKSIGEGSFFNLRFKHEFCFFYAPLPLRLLFCLRFHLPKASESPDNPL